MSSGAIVVELLPRLDVIKLLTAGPVGTGVLPAATELGI